MWLPGSGGDEKSQQIDPEFSRLLFNLSGDTELAGLRDHYREIELRDGAFMNPNGSVVPPRLSFDQVHPHIIMKPRDDSFTGA